MSFGAVTALGSVWVNGVHYDTSQATFAINGQPGTLTHLNVGDVVHIVGSVDTEHGTGVARRVVVDSLVQRPISAIDAFGSSLVALGQTVQVDGCTLFDAAISDGSLGGLRVGDFVERSGFRSASGTIKGRAHRSRGARTSRTRDDRRRGLGGRRRAALRIGPLVVDHGAAMLQAFASGMTALGDVVEARSSLSDGSLVATSVELASRRIR